MQSLHTKWFGVHIKLNISTAGIQPSPPPAAVIKPVRAPPLPCIRSPFWSSNSSRVAVYLGGADVMQHTWVPYTRVSYPVEDSKVVTTLTDLVRGKG